MPMVIVEVGSRGLGRAYSRLEVVDSFADMGQGHGGYRIGHILDEAAGHDPAVVLGQILDDSGRAELGVLVRDHLGELGGGTDRDPGVAVERAVGPAAPAALVDVAFDRRRRRGSGTPS